MSNYAYVPNKPLVFAAIQHIFHQIVICRIYLIKVLNIPFIIYLILNIVIFVSYGKAGIFNKRGTYIILHMVLCSCCEAFNVPF
ncbi:hypothetical protein MXE27_10265 [Methanobacterium alcaliphilum]|nr:hypothetical protein [Methanobacterium alcaliphilum]